MDDLASEMGVSSDSLASMLNVIFFCQPCCLRTFSCIARANPLMFIISSWYIFHLTLLLIHVWSLTLFKQDDHIVSEVHCKVVKWLRNRPNVGNVQKTLRVKIKPTLATKSETGVADNTDSVKLTDPEISDNVPVKSVPPHRRTKNNIRIGKDDKLCSATDMLMNDRLKKDEVQPYLHDVDSSPIEDPPCSSPQKVWIF